VKKLTQKSPAMKDYCIITSCSKRKLDQKAKACQLYQGQFFKAVAQLSHTLKTDLHILSAKYGLISSNKEIEPYEKRLKNKRDVNEIRKNLSPIMETIFENYKVIILLMGNLYESIFQDYLTGAQKERFILSEDHRGSGGYNQLISFLNGFSLLDLLVYLKWIQSKSQKISNQSIKQYFKKTST
jgi:Family of unknown function (DUF6884)